MEQPQNQAIAAAAAAVVPATVVKKFKAPKYSEDEDIEEYFRMFERVQAINGWNEMEAAAELCNALGGAAQRIVYKAPVTATYEQLKGLLLNRLTKTAEEHYLSSSSTLRVEGDNLFDIYEKTKSTIQKGYGDYLEIPPARRVQLELTCFSRSLPSVNMRHAVALGNPQTLDEALQIARECQMRELDCNDRTSQKRTKLRQVTEEKVETAPTTEPEWVGVLKQQLADIQLMAVTALEASKKEEKKIKCYICDADNHIASGCLLNRNRLNRNQNNRSQNNMNKTRRNYDNSRTRQQGNE